MVRTLKLKSLVFENKGSSPGVTGDLASDEGQWLDSVRSSSVDPDLHEYQKKRRVGKQDGCVKAKDGSPPPHPLLHFLAEEPCNGNQQYQ